MSNIRRFWKVEQAHIAEFERIIVFSCDKKGHSTFLHLITNIQILIFCLVTKQIGVDYQRLQNY